MQLKITVCEWKSTLKENSRAFVFILNLFESETGPGEDIESTTEMHNPQSVTVEIEALQLYFSWCYLFFSIFQNEV